MSEQVEYAVEVKDLTVQFGDFKAVNHISFEVPKGEIFGFLGANGAGKTTTIRVLCGLLIPNEGRVKIAGIELNENSNQEVKKKVGYMSQKFTLYDDLTVGENLSFTASLRKLEQTYYERREKELFEFISFNKSTQSLVRDLPGGMKQQVSLAAALLHDPEIIFLDEPTAGVTSASRARFWALIQALAKQGKTIFVTTHYMDEAEQCERIALMRSGEIIALDGPAQLKKSAFPTPLYELSPLKSITFEEIEKIKQSGIFNSFESYGLRFHGAVLDPQKWEAFKRARSGEFSIREIQPSLEDVFIQMVEGKNR
jgi:ABC-2 type transport system ATP-binding protein